MRQKLDTRRTLTRRLCFVLPSWADGSKLSFRRFEVLLQSAELLRWWFSFRWVKTASSKRINKECRKQTKQNIVQYETFKSISPRHAHVPGKKRYRSFGRVHTVHPPANMWKLELQLYSYSCCRVRQSLLKAQRKGGSKAFSETQRLWGCTALRACHKL